VTATLTPTFVVGHAWSPCHGCGRGPGVVDAGSWSRGRGRGVVVALP
jgi:hypothetical protein